MADTSFLNGKHVLMLLAHCDDEIICGWPIFQNKNIKKSVLIVTSDRFNKERVQFAHRKFVFNEVCASHGVAGHCMDYNSDFYKLSGRTGQIKKLHQDLIKEVDKFRPFDYIFTHNPYGEYGHLDHKYLFDFSFNMVPEKMLVTDIFIESDWNSLVKPSSRSKDVYFKSPVCEAQINHQSYADVEKIYRKHNAWTWSSPPVESCKLYSIN